MSIQRVSAPVPHSAPGYIRAAVLDVEITEPIPSIAPYDDQGRRVRSVWMLVRMQTQPIGTALIENPATGLAAADLAHQIYDQFAEVIRSRASEMDIALGETVHAGGLTATAPSAYLQKRQLVLADAPPITVAVCTRGRPDALTRCLESLLAQDYPNFRILVVDNAPMDDETEIVARNFAERGPVDYIVAPIPGLSHARNAALNHQQDAILASIDDDERADPHWLAEIARAFAEVPEADAVTGLIVPAQLDTDAQMWFEQFGGHSKGWDLTRFVFSPLTSHLFDPLFPLPPFGAGGNMAFRPGVMQRLGGFDVALGAGTPAMGAEDTHAFTQLLRAGGTIVLEPSALVHHYHRRDFDSLARQFLGYGTGLTAHYASLLWKEPWVVFSLLRLAPRALREVLGSKGLRSASIDDDFPRELLKVNRRGLLTGPWAYVRSRKSERRRRRGSRKE